MHDEYWAPIEPRLRPGGVVLVNDATFAHEIDAPVTVHRIAATETAAELGTPMSAAMVIAGAYVGVTGLVGVDALVAAMRASLPPYRRQHIEANERAIAAGHALVELDSHPAWAYVEASR